MFHGTSQVSHKSALKAPSISGAPRPAKQVSFTLQDRVRYIRPGRGTWENGEPRARRPSEWELNNQQRLVDDTLAEIDRIERSELLERQTRRKPLPAESPLREGYFNQSNWSELQVSGNPVQVPSPLRMVQQAPGLDEGNVTFDDFLTKDQMAEGEPKASKRRRTSSVKCVASSFASVKSLSKAFRNKLRGKDKHQE